MLVSSLVVIGIFLSPSLAQICEECECRDDRISCRRAYINGLVSGSLIQDEDYPNVVRCDFKTSDLEGIDFEDVFRLFPNAESIDLRDGINLDCDYLSNIETSVDILSDCPGRQTPSTRKPPQTTLSQTPPQDTSRSTLTKTSRQVPSPTPQSKKESHTPEDITDDHTVVIVLATVFPILLVGLLVIMLLWCCCHDDTPAPRPNLPKLRTSPTPSRRSSEL